MASLTVESAPDSADATTRILMTGSRNWSDAQISQDALHAAMALLNSYSSDTVLVHGGARGADLLVASEAHKLGMTTEAHPADWNHHSESCPEWDRKNPTCKLAGFHRNTQMIRAGADLCLAFPTHGYVLAPGESRTETSRGTWNCAEEAKKADIPTLVVWGTSLYPFGFPAVELLRADMLTKKTGIGHQGEVSIVDAWLPF